MKNENEDRRELVSRQGYELYMELMYGQMKLLQVYKTHLGVGDLGLGGLDNSSFL